MSIALPNPSAAKPGGSLTIFGRKISYDALLLAAASLAGVFFLYKVGQVNTPLVDTSSIDPNAGSAGDFSTISTQPAPAPPPTGTWNGGSPYPVTNPAAQSTIPSHGAPSPGSVVQWQGTLGSGGGPNTTGRSSGSQIYGGGDDSTPAPSSGGGSGGHAQSSGLSGSGSGGNASGNPPPTGSVTGGQNAQGKNRGSGGQILQ